jgi:hypothetical protein
MGWLYGGIAVVVVALLLVGLLVDRRAPAGPPGTDEPGSARVAALSACPR